MAKTNKDNLVSLGDRTTSEQRRIAKKGGIASGIARRAKREAKEWAKICLDEDVKGKGGEAVPTRYAMIMKQIQKAINKGDNESFRNVLKLAGEWENETALTAPVVVVVNTTSKGAKAMDKLKEVD